MTADSQHAHGGARPGAGRPKTGQPWRVKFSVTVDPGVLERLNEYCRDAEVKRSRVVEEAILRRIER